MLGSPAYFLLAALLFLAVHVPGTLRGRGSSSVLAHAFPTSDFDEMELQLGANLFEKDREVSNETVKKVLDGVEKGNKESIYFFALMKLYGISLSKEPTIAAKNFEKAAKLGHPEATTAYGMMLLHGNGVEKDEALAVTYFRRGVQFKDVNAHWLLGKVLMESKAASAPVHEEAVKLFQYAASMNVPQAQHLLAVMHEYGLGTPQDFALAADFYRRASGQDYYESSYHLALMYAYGRIPPQQDFRKALALLERGARSEHAPSVYYMGVFKLHGYGCMPDYERALNWFERAAGMGDFRVSQKAADAASELRGLIQTAEDANNAMLQRYADMADAQPGAGAAGAHSEEYDDEDEEEA
jgi:TPR repeat protein